MYQLVDFVSKQPVQATGLVFADNNTPWEILMDLSLFKQKHPLENFKRESPRLSKYLPLMPIENPENFVTLQEIPTPLINSKNLGPDFGIDLLFKVEGKTLTGSFKDRGSALEVSVAKELGAKAIILASTGNMAASCACYAAAAKMPCYILVPEGVPMNKMAQVIAFGGHIVQIKGTYNDAARLAESLARKMGFYLAGDYAYRLEGQKTAAFELVDQLAGQAPDVVIVPMGCGTNIAAYAKGFKEYLELGLIDKLPQLIGVEATGADAIVRSFNKKEKHITPLKSINTIASAIAVPDPIDGIKALDAIYSTKGQAVAVSDEEILQAQYLLATHESIFAESSSAATIATVLKIGQQLKGKKVVCILTGDGLKDASVVLKSATKPLTIHANEAEFMQLYDQKIFSGKNMFFSDKNQVLFSQSPSVNQIQAQIKDLFLVEYHQDYLTKIKLILDKILNKGKHITIADLQDAIQEALETQAIKNNKSFSVVDFEVTTGKDRKSRAQITVDIAGVKQQGQAEGPGPVDAVIKALRVACQDKIDFKLLDYKVEIRNHGVDALVHVELKLAKNNIFSVGHGVSPDIIQASLEAFEEAYNE
ncbi:MAG: threonine synthase [Legionellales bacterium]|jgi:threonine synthase